MLILKYILFAINTLIYQVHHLKSEISTYLNVSKFDFYYLPFAGRVLFGLSPIESQVLTAKC